MARKDSFKSDRELGMQRPIDRRDFLQGAAMAMVAAGALSPELAAAAATEAAAQDKPGYYPPILTGMRGSHPGSFEPAHAIRDHGSLQASAFNSPPTDTGEEYDLIVVGGGISGLSAAHFYRAAAGRPVRILILDNHDDFGGHAKRNEYHLDGKLQIMNGGTLGIESPTPYSPVADGLMKTLGIHPEALAKTCNDPGLYRDMGLRGGVFFDKETFGVDRFVLGPARRRRGDSGPDAAGTQAFLAQTPLSPAVQRDILAIETGDVDYMPGLTSDQKKDRLSRISYADYLLKVVKADPGVVTYYQRRTDGLWGCGIDAVSAIDCWGSDLPGFQGLKLAPGAMDRMGYTPKGQVATGGSYEFHFPDGNASIARSLVRNLIPAAMPGSSALDIVTARADYSQLDRAGQGVRIRLSSIVGKVTNTGGPTSRSGVEVVYIRGGKSYSARARHCVLASWNMMIPYLCPELPEAQKAALHYLVKTPLVYTTVALRNWTAFHKLGVSSIACPGGYHSGISLNQTVNIGDYRSPRSPEEPILIRMTRTPAAPGLPEREQHKAGRAELLATPFETFERNIRDQLGRCLAGGGFDPARDITGITVNRWPHGYAPEYNALIDPDEGLPLKAARARFGAITIANSDCGGGAYTDVAMDQAHRAVTELLS
jgi:spermidine dehydrogenase